MKAFHDDIKIKQEYYKRLRDHYRADELIQGIYWENGKGCAVGCTLHSSDHSQYPSELGLPVWWGVVVDRVFERLSPQSAKYWSIKSLASVPVGKEIKLKDTMLTILNFVKSNVNLSDFGEVEGFLDNIIFLYENNGSIEEFENAAAAAAAYTTYAYAYADVYADVYIADAVVYAADDDNIRNLARKLLECWRS